MSTSTLFADRLFALLESLQAALTSTEFYLQSMLIGVALLPALLAGSAVRRWIRRQKEPLAHAPLLITDAALAVVLLAVAQPVALRWISASDVVMVAGKLALAWLIVQIARLMVQRKLAITIITCVVFAYTILSLAGLLEPTLVYLDAQAIKLGSIRISVRDVLEGASALALLLWLAHTLSRLVTRAFESAEGMDLGAREILSKLATITFYVMAILITLNVVGINLTALAIFGGALGVGIGLGLQKITANFVSGIVLLFEKSVRVGDLIQLNEEIGWVRGMSVRYLRLETYDGREVMVPNEEMIIGRVINWTLTHTRARIDIDLSIPYGSDVELAMRLLLEAARAHPLCLKDPAPACFVRKFGDSGLGILLNFWVADVREGRYAPQSDVMRSVLTSFKSHGISFATPTREIITHSAG